MKRNNKTKVARKKRSIYLWSSLSIFFVMFAVVLAGIVMDANDRKITNLNDVYINNLGVRGYTVTRAENAVLTDINNKLDGININLIYKDKSWHFDESDFEVDTAVKDVVNLAFRTNKLDDRQSVALINQKKGRFDVSIGAVFKNFDQKIDDIVNEINKEPIDASVEFKPNQTQMFKINNAECGVKVDREKLVEELECQFLKNKQINIEVPVLEIEPNVKSDYFDDKLNLMSKFTTSIKNSQAGRRNNVSVALKKVNGTVVKPDEIVSFNKLTSPQDASGGYQNAIIILNGVYTNGMGGGICQASTTLYNALVLANLEIEEVHKHTIPVHYVEHALDAMISDGYADLIFKNTSENDVYIKSYVDGDDAVVEIYGKTIPDGVTIKRVSEEKTIAHGGDKVIVDENGEYASKVLYKGEYYRLKWPENGYDAKAYKEYYKDGQLIDREEIRHEVYAPQEGVVIEGAKELPEGFVLPEQDVKIYPPQSE